MRVLKVLGVLLVVVVCAVALMWFMGSRLPYAHTASSSIVIATPEAHTWQMIEDIHSQASWREGLLSVEDLPPENGHRCWTEVEKHMRMPMCEDVATAPTMRVVRIADPKLPFGGTWTYKLRPIGAGATLLNITEDGTTGPALYRFLGHYVYHEDTMIKQYEDELQKAAAK